MPTLREYNNLTDRAQVIALWKTVFGYETAHNDPDLVIDTKAQVGDRLFFVAAEGPAIVGTAMAGYDGHRGWLYAIAVHPDHRGADVGSRLVRHAESALARLGCLKINLQLVTSNEATAAFYRSLGYVVEPRISMGKVLPQNALPGKAAVTRKLISSGSPFESQIAYSRAVVDGDWIFVSGTTGFDYANMTIADSAAAQAEQCLKNIQAALQQANADLRDVVRVHYILPDGADFESCWPVLQRYLGDVRPAATMFVAGLLDPRMKIEIEVTARKRNQQP